MSTVEKFSPDMIERFLKGRDLKYLKDSDDDFQARFYDEEGGPELTMWFLSQGTQKEIYCIMTLSDRSIPKSNWGRAVFFCNTWNKEMRWPKAYLQVSDPDSDTTGQIILEGQIDLEQGIHQELFNDFSNLIMGSATSFWERAHKEEGF